MIKVNQTYLGEKGNCVAACVASLFNTELKKVPRFEVYNNDEFYTAVNLFFLNKGYSVIETENEEEAKKSDIEGYYIAILETTQYGCYHSVIMHNGRLYHDPLPVRTTFKSKNISLFWTFRKIKNGN